MKKMLLPALAFIAGCVAVSSCGKDAVMLPDAAESSSASVLATTTATAGTLEQDSLALVDLYNELAGDNWFHSSGWLSEEPVANWEGVKTEQVGGKTRVVGLFLGANNLKGTVPQSLARLSALRTLNLQYNRELKGAFPEAIYSLSELRSLRLAQTSFTGGLSEMLGNLKQLDTLDLRTSPYDLSMWWDGNEATAKEHRPNKYRLTGALPATIGQLTNLRFLDLSHQRFSGQLPESLGQLAKLDTLELSNCRFEGNIPASLGNIAGLKYLSLAGNKLTGEIPQSIGKLTKLKELWLRRNELSGSIPNLSALQDLKQLGLEKNKLNGVIPQSLSELKNIYVIYLGENKLEGALPANLGGPQQVNLMYVDVRGNNVTGTLSPQNTTRAKLLK